MARLSISKRYLEELVQATLQDEILEVTIQVPEEGRLRVTGRIVVEEAPEEIRGFLEEMLMTELPGWDVEVDGLFISPELLPNLPFKAQQIAQFPEAVYFIEKVKTNLFRIWVRHQSLFLSKKRNRISKLRDAFPEATLEFRALGSEEDITLLRTLPAVQAWIAPFVKNVSGLAPENFHAYRTDRNKQSIWLAHNSDVSFPALRTLRHRIMSATDVLAVFEYRMSRADARAKLEAALTALGWIESYHVSFQEKHSIFLVSVDTEQSRMEALAGIARRLAEDTGFRVEMKIDVERDSMIVRLAKAFPEDGILTWIKHVDASLYEVEAYIPFDPQRERLEAWSDEMEETWGAKILFSDPFMRSPDFRFRELRGDDAETIAKRYNRPGEFSPSALALAEELASIHWEEALTQRLDFRETPVMSIDPVRTKDLDDALSITSLEEGGFEVGVHIADVAPFVPQGSALDQEALSRGFTTYLVEGEIPVIPPALSDQACSLHGGQDSLALSVFIRMDAMGLMQDFEVKRCVIHNWKRFSYAEVQAILNGGDHEFSWQILTLGRLSRLMRASRKAAGALDLSLDDDPEKESHQLIEEFMLQANECVSRFLGEKHPAGVCLFRIHPDVTDNSMEALNQLAQHLKIQVKIKDQGTMQRALEAVL